MLRIEGDTARRLIRQMRPYRKVAPIQAVQVNEPFVIDQDSSDAPVNGSVIAAAGSYLAMSPAGTLYPIPRQEFEQMYKEMGDE